MEVLPKLPRPLLISFTRGGLGEAALEASAQRASMPRSNSQVKQPIRGHIISSFPGPRSNLHPHFKYKEAILASIPFKTCWISIYDLLH